MDLNADYLNLVANAKFSKKYLENDRILFSGKVIKINQTGKRQERHLAVTEHFILNLKKFEVKRKIEIGQLKAITQSLTSKEFVIHVNKSYDYRYNSSDYR